MQLDTKSNEFVLAVVAQILLLLLGFLAVLSLWIIHHVVAWGVDPILLGLVTMILSLAVCIATIVVSNLRMFQPANLSAWQRRTLIALRVLLCPGVVALAVAAFWSGMIIVHIAQCPGGHWEYQRNPPGWMWLLILASCSAGALLVWALAMIRKKVRCKVFVVRLQRAQAGLRESPHATGNKS
jgi:hypothetical protein